MQLLGKVGNRPGGGTLFVRSKESAELLTRAQDVWPGCFCFAAGMLSNQEVIIVSSVGFLRLRAVPNKVRLLRNTHSFRSPKAEGAISNCCMVLLGCFAFHRDDKLLVAPVNPVQDQRRERHSCCCLGVPQFVLGCRACKKPARDHFRKVSRHYSRRFFCSDLRPCTSS